MKKLRLTGGEPLIRRDLERLIAMLAELDADLTLTTNASLLPRKARALAGRRPRPHHGQPRRDGRRDLPRDERRRLPGRARARGDRGRARGRASRSRSIASSSAASTRTRSSRSPATSARPATRCASSSSWTSARPTAGAWTTSSPPARSSRRIDARVPARACRRPVPRRGRQALALPRRQGRDRRHLLGHRALLRRLHPLARLGRRASSTPACSRCAATTCAR